jgi:hypothetical protein
MYTAGLDPNQKTEQCHHPINKKSPFAMLTKRLPKALREGDMQWYHLAHDCFPGLLTFSP